MKPMMLLSLFLMSIGIAAYAEGREVGNGGDAVVCRDSAGGIISAGMLDLYEARELYGLTVNDSTMPPRAQSITALDKLHGFADDYRGLVLAEVNEVLGRMRLMHRGVVLTDVRDSGHLIYPQGCAVEQVANFNDEYGLLVSRDIWDHFSETDKSALITHEAVYKLERSFYGARVSSGARKITAYLHSDAALTAPSWREISKKSRARFRDQVADASFLNEDRFNRENADGIWRGLTGTLLSELQGEWLLTGYLQVDHQEGFSRNGFPARLAFAGTTAMERLDCSGDGCRSFSQVSHAAANSIENRAVLRENNGKCRLVSLNRLLCRWHRSFILGDLNIYQSFARVRQQ